MKKRGKLLSASARELRTKEMVRRFDAGETLQSIGDDYGITRERVRQIVKKAGSIERQKLFALKRQGVATWIKLGATVEEVAARYGVPDVTIRRWMYQEGVRIPPKPWTHGINGYTWRKCRCSICRGANALRAQETRAKRLLRYGDKIPSFVVHGKPSTYGNWRCRCELCKEAWRVHMRRQNILNKRPAAIAHRKAKLATFGPERHGLMQTYTYYGCRCDKCKAAMEPSWAKLREHQAAKRNKT